MRFPFSGITIYIPHFLPSQSLRDSSPKGRAKGGITHIFLIIPQCFTKSKEKESRFRLSFVILLAAGRYFLKKVTQKLLLLYLSILITVALYIGTV